jgi:hypothetical protein
MYTAPNKCFSCGDFKPRESIANAHPHGRAPARTVQGVVSASVDSYQVQIATLYNELLFSVERCFPGESRHQTALRYIREAESRASQSGACMQNTNMRLEERSAAE